MNIIWTILILGVMIFIHELGHFISARAFGVKVNEFALGMGPAILKKQGKETLYSLRLFPIGGYCAMVGEDEKTDEEGSLSALPPWKRLIILASGAFMNILLALILFTVISFSQKAVITPVIGEITDENAPISVFSEGDKIVKIDGTKINIYNDFTLKMYENNGESVEITVERNGERITKSVTPEKTEAGYKFGFYPLIVENSPALALKNGFYETAFSVKSVFWTLKNLFTGVLGLDAVSGPVGIATVVDDVVDEVNKEEDLKTRSLLMFLNIANLMALIGANLGVMNLLPLPALDGGRILFTLIEMITRKKVPEKFEAWVHGLGFILFMLFALFITWSDISKLIK